MLSLTHSVVDVKTHLEQGYAAFNLDNEVAFTNAVILALEDAQYLYMYPVLGSTAYTTIQTKDKVDLEEKEIYLYYGEIYYACMFFIERRITSISASESNASSEKLKVEGYEYESNTGTSSSSMSISVKEYYDKALHYMGNAGYSVCNLQRGGSIYATPDDSYLYQGEVE